MNNYQNFLFIDDSQNDNFFTLSIIELDKLPINPHFEINPVEALQYLHRIPDPDFPNIIIVDINMPLMTGFEFVAQYQLDFHNGHPCTLLFMTSSSRRPSEISKVRQNPIVTDFLQKPFSKQIYLQIIQYLKLVPR